MPKTLSKKPDQLPSFLLPNNFIPKSVPSFLSPLLSCHSFIEQSRILKQLLPTLRETKLSREEEAGVIELLFGIFLSEDISVSQILQSVSTSLNQLLRNWRGKDTRREETSEEQNEFHNRLKELVNRLLLELEKIDSPIVCIRLRIIVEEEWFLSLIASNLPKLFNVIQKHLSSFLHCLRSQPAQPLIDLSPGLCHCESLLHLQSQLLYRFREVLQKGGIKSGYLWDSFQTVVGLVQERLCLRDAKLAAAFSLANFLLILQDQKNLPQNLLSAFRSSQNQANEKEVESSGNSEERLVWKEVENMLRTGGILCRQCVLSGIVVTASPHFLLQPLPSLPNSANEEVLEELYKEVKEVLSSNCTVFEKLQATRALHSFLTCLSRYFQACLPNEVRPWVIDFTETLLKDSLKECWAHWENPFDPIANQIKLTFEAIVQLSEDLKEYLEKSGLNTDRGRETFLLQLKSSLVNADWANKAKYGMLRTLVKRHGSIFLLELLPNFPSDLLGSFKIPSMATTVCSLFEAFLNNIKEDSRPQNLFLEPLAKALVERDPIFQTGISTYALPAFLLKYPDSFSALFRLLYSPTQSGSLSVPQLQAIISLLKQARKQGLIDASFSLPNDEWISGVVKGVVDLCSEVQCEEVRYQCLEFLTVARKSTEAPHPLQLELLKEFILSNLKVASTSFRSKFTVTLQKLSLRLKEATKKKHTTLAARLAKLPPSSSSSLFPRFADDEVNFLNWLGDIFIKNMYPGSPFQRKSLALSLYLSAIVDVWSNASPQLVGCDPSFLFQCYGPSKDNLSLEIFSQDKLDLIVDTIWDNYDSNRKSAVEILLRLDKSVGVVVDANRLTQRGFLQTALSDLSSSKARETDSAALFFVFLYLQLLKNNAFSLSLSPLSLQPPNPTFPGSVGFVKELLRMLNITFHKNYAAVGNNTLLYSLHGYLLTIRYVLERTNFEEEHQKKHFKHWEGVISELVEEVIGVVRRCLFVVTSSAPEGGFETSLLHRHLQPQLEQNEEQQEYFSKSAAQQRAVNTWLAVKEGCLLLGALPSFLPLPVSSSKFYPNTPDKEMKALLTETQIKQLGEELLMVLYTAKHKGALGKAYLGFTSFCDSLFKANSSSLLAFTLSWLRDLLEQVQKGEENKVSRRSAGLPFAILSLLRAEAKLRKSENVLLSTALNSLLQVASAPLNPSSPSSSVLAKVHGLNVLRAIFQDTVLAEAVSPFVSRAFEVVLNAYESPIWAISNSANLTFSALLGRTVSSRRSGDSSLYLNKLPSPSLFFNRHPSLFNFFLQILSKGVGGKSMYGVLVLLSKLGPSTSDDFSLNKWDMSLFRDIISKTALLSPDFQVRELAAKAVGTLYTEKEIEKEILKGDTCYFLSVEVDSLVSHRLAHNQLHASLLQLCGLLRGFSEKRPLERILEKVWERVTAFSNNVSTCGCYGVFEGCLEVLSVFADVGRKQLLPSQLKPILSRLIQFIFDEPPQLGNEQPMRVVCYTKATKLLVESILFSLSSSCLEEPLLLLQQLLSHPLPYVRAQFLSSLLLYYKQTERDPHNTNEKEREGKQEIVKLKAKLVERLKEERDGECYYKLIKVVRRSDQLSLSDFSAATNSVSVLTVLLQRYPLLNLKTQLAILPLFGKLLALVNEESEEGISKLLDSELSQLEQVARIWINILPRYTSPEKSTSYRIAAAKSLALFELRYIPNQSQSITRSRLLEEATVVGWLQTLILLQDDDSLVRDISSSFVTDALSYEKGQGKGDFRRESNVVAGRVYELLTQHFSHRVEYYRFLFSNLFPPQLSLSSSGQIENIIENADKNKDKEEEGIVCFKTEVFEKEEDNFWEEKVEGVHLSFRELSKGVLLLHASPQTLLPIKQHLLQLSLSFSLSLQQEGKIVLNKQPSLLLDASQLILSYCLISQTLSKLGVDSNNNEEWQTCVGGMKKCESPLFTFFDESVFLRQPADSLLRNLFLIRT